MYSLGINRSYVLYLHNTKTNTMKKQLNTQGLTLTEGDQFTTKGGNIIYTFHFWKQNEKYGFPEMHTSSDIDDRITGTFRIDNMVEHQIFINKI